jgi:hypothetical protein
VEQKLKVLSAPILKGLHFIIDAMQPVDATLRSFFTPIRNKAKEVYGLSADNTHTKLIHKWMRMGKAHRAAFAVGQVAAPIKQVVKTV